METKSTTMSISAWILAIAVGLSNIAFNVQAQQTAAYAISWKQGLWSMQFSVLFVLGCTSLLLLYTFYCQQVPLARGILLMGAVSIMGGAAFGVFVRGNRLDAIERCLLLAIALLFLYRLFQSVLTRAHTL